MSESKTKTPTHLSEEQVKAMETLRSAASAEASCLMSHFLHIGTFVWRAGTILGGLEQAAQWAEKSADVPPLVVRLSLTALVHTTRCDPGLRANMAIGGESADAIIFAVQSYLDATRKPGEKQEGS